MRNVLIIDNNAEVVEELKRIFTAQGCRVFTATTAKTAFARIRSLQTNDVVIDLALVSDRVPGPMGADLPAYASDRLGIQAKRLVSPVPSTPAVDYDDILKQYRREMREKDWDITYKERAKKYRETHGRTFWTFDNGVKKVNK